MVLVPPRTVTRVRAAYPAPLMFRLGRGGSRRDLHLPVDKIGEIVGGEVVKLEVTADQVKGIGFIWGLGPR